MNFKVVLASEEDVQAIIRDLIITLKGGSNSFVVITVFGLLISRTGFDVGQQSSKVSIIGISTASPDIQRLCVDLESRRVI